MNSDSLLRLPFLEARTYLHGTTLFQALLPMVPAEARLSFSIGRRIESDRVQVYHRANSNTPHNGEAARLVWQANGAACALGVIPMPPSSEIARRPYVEALVTDQLVRQGASVMLAKKPPYSMVETLVPMFKSLLKTVATPGPGQWMFTRLDLDSRVESFVPLRLTLDAVLAGKLARSSVECRGDSLGALYFSWVAGRSSQQLDGSQE